MPPKHISKNKKNKPVSSSNSGKSASGSTSSNNPAAEAAKKHMAEIRARQEEEARLLAIEEEKIRLEEEEEAKRIAEIEAERERKRQIREAKKAKQIADGTYRTNAEKKRDRKIAEARARVEEMSAQRSVFKMDKIEESVDEIQETFETNLKSLIVCVMGHVDTGKTSLLDKVRHSNIQGKEVAGITQQIGASFKPRETLPTFPGNMLPGMLFIDTPGHQAFSNLRSRGTSICNVVILVVDILKGIENQTMESIDICREGGIPFIIALNKVDRLYGWNELEDMSFKDKIDHESISGEFRAKYGKVEVDFSRIETTISLFETDDPEAIVVCPVSAKTGEGLDELLVSVMKYSQTYLQQELTWTPETEVITMETKKEDREATTIDAIVTDGKLTVGSWIGVSTTSGPVTTKIRLLMLPAVDAEMRMTNNYQSVPSVRGSCGVKIVADNLDGAIPGAPIFILNDKNEHFECFNNHIEIDDEGVTVYAPSIGQLEALVSFLRNDCTPRVPVGRIGVGKVYKNSILTIPNYFRRGQGDHAVILCFDCPLEDKAAEFTRKENIQVFSNSTIYRLYEQYMAWFKDRDAIRMEGIRSTAIFPLRATIISCFRKTKNMVLGITVEEGRVQVGTPICVSKEGDVVDIGTVVEIRQDDRSINVSRKGTNVSISIDTTMMFGRHVVNDDILMAHMTRSSLDTLKEHFSDDLSREEKELCFHQKRILQIPDR